MNIENTELLPSKYKNVEHLYAINKHIKLLIILIFCCHTFNIFM